jgi:hypothetical protein
MIVDLYPASIFLNPVISSPIYRNFNQSQILVRSSVECSVDSLINVLKSLQASRHRVRGCLRISTSSSHVVDRTLERSQY